MTKTIPLFDPITAWEGLSKEAQAEIGIAAIVFGIGSAGVMDGRAPMQGFEAAAHTGETALMALVQEAVGGDLAEVPRPDLSALGVNACRECGCTDDCACPDQCSWVEPDLCSTCARQLASGGAAEPVAGDDAGGVLTGLPAALEVEALDHG